MQETHARVPQEQFGSPSERGREWWSGPALPGALIVVILALLYRSIVRDLALQWWDDPNYSHGFLVPSSPGSSYGTSATSCRPWLPEAPYSAWWCWLRASWSCSSEIWEPRIF